MEVHETDSIDDMTQKSHDSLIPHLHFFLNFSGDVDGGGHYRAVSPDASCPEVGGAGVLGVVLLIYRLCVGTRRMRSGSGTVFSWMGAELRLRRPLLSWRR